MSGSGKRTLLQQLAEGLVAVALVLVAFGIIMLVLNALFPHGGLQLFTGTGSNVRGSETLQRTGRQIELARDGESAPLATEDWAATLVDLRNVVKSKRSVDIAWQEAVRGMPLYSLDAVQTLDDSTARIRFDSRNAIDLGANSLIVIRRMEQDLLFKEKRSFMVVVDGELRGKLGGEDGDVFLEVTTPNAVTRLQSSAATGTPVEFSIRVDEDALSTVTLFSGNAEVEAGGETVRLAPNQATRIEGQSAPSAPVLLPPTATPLTPSADALFAYRDLVPRVAFSWQAPPGVEQFRLQLARDREFRQLKLDEIVNLPRFTHGNLEEGVWFWRVSCRGAAGEGEFSPARSLRLVRDREPPPLELEPPPERIAAATFELHGRTERDARLYIGGARVEVAEDGGFRHRVALEPGINVLVLEATDAAGNVSYVSHLLTALPGE